MCLGTRAAANGHSPAERAAPSLEVVRVLVVPTLQAPRGRDRREPGGLAQLLRPNVPRDRFSARSTPPRSCETSGTPDPRRAGPEGDGLHRRVRRSPPAGRKPFYATQNAARAGSGVRACRAGPKPTEHERGSTQAFREGYPCQARSWLPRLTSQPAPANTVRRRAPLRLPLRYRQGPRAESLKSPLGARGSVCSRRDHTGGSACRSLRIRASRKRVQGDGELKVRWRTGTKSRRHQTHRRGEAAAGAPFLSQRQGSVRAVRLSLPTSSLLSCQTR